MVFALPLILAFASGANGCTGVVEGQGPGADPAEGTAIGGGSAVPNGSGGLGHGVEQPGGPDATPPSRNAFQGQPAYYRLVRLTHDQWENSIQEVLGLSEPPRESAGFVPDPPDGTFSNNERALYITDNLRLDYQRAAEIVAEGFARDSARLASWGTDSNAAIQTVGRRAFRRTLTPEEVARYAALWTTGADHFASGDHFADGARIFLEALFQSPNFLHRVELTEAGQRLSGPELATKLSFLLRNSTPSEQLLDQAEAGALDTDEGVRAAASRMIEDGFAVEVMEQFHNELFGLSRYESIAKDQNTFPDYTDALNQVLYEADVMFFSYIFQTGGGVRQVLTSDVAFVNDATAPYYGLSAEGSDLSQVQLDGSRPGFLTRIGFLAYNANLSSPDPIHRGVDINKRLLCAEMEPPPGEIPALPTPVPGQTNRERVTAHTGEGTCGGCHNQIINPPGFALEGFDAMGQIRTTDNGKPIDTSGTYALLDGEQSFQGIEELAPMLAQSSRVHSCYAAHLAEYVLSRDIGAGETALLSELGQSSLSADSSIKELLLSAISHPQFTTATSGTP